MSDIQPDPFAQQNAEFTEELRDAIDRREAARTRQLQVEAISRPFRERFFDEVRETLVQSFEQIGEGRPLLDVVEQLYGCRDYIGIDVYARDAAQAIQEQITKLGYDALGAKALR